MNDWRPEADRLYSTGIGKDDVYERLKGRGPEKKSETICPVKKA